MAQKSLPPLHALCAVLLAVASLSLIPHVSSSQTSPGEQKSQLTDSQQQPRDLTKRSADVEDLALDGDAAADADAALLAQDKRYFRTDLGKRDNDKRYYGFKADLGKRDEDDAGDNENDDIKRYYSGFMSDLGKRYFRGDLGKRMYRYDLGKRDDVTDDESEAAREWDALLDEVQKRYYSFRSDMGKRSDDSEGGDMDLDKRYMFRGDLGKRPYFRGDLGKRPYYKRPSFRGDLGKRGYRADLGKRPSFRGDLGKRAFRMDLGKRASFRGDLGKRPFFRADLGKRASFRNDLGKRASFRSDLGKRSAESPAAGQKEESKP